MKNKTVVTIRDIILGLFLVAFIVTLVIISMQNMNYVETLNKVK